MNQIPIYQPRYNYYPVYNLPLNNNQTNNLNSIHSKYYPDLTNDEFLLNPAQRNILLYERGKLEQLAKYGTLTNCGFLYNKIKNNPDFRELISSKYLNNAEGFVKLVNNLNSLEAERTRILSYKMQYPAHYNQSMYKKPIQYEKYSINDYMRLLNDFIKNPKLSDDIKQYFLYMKSDKLDLYYAKLDKINTAQNPLNVLIEKIPYVNE